MGQCIKGTLDKQNEIYPIVLKLKVLMTLNLALNPRSRNHSLSLYTPHGPSLSHDNQQPAAEENSLDLTNGSKVWTSGRQKITS